MFLRPNHRSKDGKDHTDGSLVETVRTPDGPRQKTLCYLGELNSSAQARWLRTVDVFNEQGEAQQLKLFPSHVEPPPDDPQVARVLLNKVRLERTDSSAPAIWGWNCGNAWNWIASSSARWTTNLRMCPGRAWRRCWRSTGCVRRVANWPSNSGGIHPLRWTICWGSKKIGRAHV